MISHLLVTINIIYTSAGAIAFVTKHVKNVYQSYYCISLMFNDISDASTWDFADIPITDYHSFYIDQYQ